MAGGGSFTEAAGGVVGGTVGQQAMPFRKAVLWTTLIFFIILATVGTIESFQAHSIGPLISRTVGKVVASDRLLGRLAEQVASEQTPAFTGFFQKSFPPFLWFWLKFVFEGISSLYFIFFFGWLLFWGFSSINNTSPLRNFLLTMLTYLILTLLISTMLFMADNAGRTLPTDKPTAVKVWALGSYPFQGVSKLVMLFAMPTTLKKIADWSESGKFLPSIITNIPTETVKMNLSSNETNATVQV